MKKLIAFIFALLCTVVLFVGCENKSMYQSTEVENVSIRISNISSTGATVIIKDTNEESFIYGVWYKIETEIDGVWYEVKTVINNYGFDDRGYYTDKNDEVKFQIDWEWIYGELPAGKYRLWKEVIQPCLNGANLQYISVTFDIVEAKQ